MKRRLRRVLAGVLDGTGVVRCPECCERSLAWVMNARRHARDYERLAQHSETLITWAAITLMTRRLTRTQPRWGQAAGRKPKAAD